MTTTGTGRRRPSERMTFRGSQGDELAARLDLPDGPVRAYALFAHCFTCSKDVVAASTISAGLVERGVGVLRFDFTGLGGSDGDFANTDFSSNVEDLLLAAAALRDRDRAPSLLVGHSLGGAAVLAATERIPESSAIATIGAPYDPGHVTKLFADELDEIHRDGEATVQLAGRPFLIRRQLLADLDAAHMDRAIAQLDRPLLVLHSPVDAQVDVDNARRIYERARHPKSFVSLDDADHLLTRRADGAYAATVLAAWASRYLPGAEEHHVDPDPAGDAIPDGVLVSEADPDRFAQRVVARGHELRADEPLGIGDDTGPTPYELLLAALGTCTSMTLRMYARRAGLPLEHVEVVLRHDREYSTDCAEAGERCRVEHIRRTITLHGPDLDEAQRAKLLDIADRCPVHRTLLGDLRIPTELAPAVDPHEGPRSR